MIHIRVSVVIPLYNKAREIIRALDNVFAQSMIPDEVIVVDDGSTDDGAAIAEEKYGDSIKVIRQPNMGVSAARNKGVSASRNEFICLLDADDEWLPGHIQEITGLISDYPEAVFYATRVFLQDELGNYLTTKVACPAGYRGLITNFADVFSRGYGLVTSSSVCIRKSIFIQQGLVFPHGERKGEDLYYWLRLGMIGSLAYSDKSLVRVCLNAQNRSVNLRAQMPYHISWYLSNRTLIANHPQYRSIRRFIHSNSLVTAYSLALGGDRHSIRMMINAFKKANNSLYALLFPALFLPTTIINQIKKLRRNLRGR